MTRPPRVLHCTSEPLVFFGRDEELRLLDAALAGGEPSVVALVGPGGQGKTAIVQHWLSQPRTPPDGLFFWSFYRAKDADLLLREWLAYAEGLDVAPEVSAAWCVDRLLAILRRERWAVVLDGAEVVQHEDGPWRGRFVHPDLGRLLEELASQPTPGIIVLTTRFELPTLARRPHLRLVALDRLDAASARDLLTSLGVRGDLDRVAAVAGRHAKAVELLGTYLVRFHEGDAARLDVVGGDDDEEASVARVLAAFQRALPEEQQDILALATAFREPPTEALLLDYLASDAIRALLHNTWRREYAPFVERPAGWLANTLDELVRLRLLERVGPGAVPVIDAHPLVRRGFEHVAGASRRESALARAGFLRGRPDRRRPDTLDEAREAVELFHAHCDAGLWAEADSAYRALDNPKHRFLAPALERELLSRFFPGGDFRQPPLWPGFGRWRSLAICLEMQGEFRAALEAYRPADAALRGDALLALGEVGPLLETRSAPAPWDALWKAYRSHALCLVGRVEEAVELAQTLVPVDVYEWVHVFECLLRAGRLDVIDPRSFLARADGEHRWADLARRRMRADYARVTIGPSDDLAEEYPALIEEYDRAGLPVERALARLSFVALLLARGEARRAAECHAVTLALIKQANLGGLESDGWEWQSRIAGELGNRGDRQEAIRCADAARERLGGSGPGRP
jgi:tetratricopeptide (TPR) repeat protein